MKLLHFILLLSISCEIYSQSLDDIAEPYFRGSEYHRMVLNPTGDYIAAETYYDAREHIEIIDISRKKSFVVFNGTNGINVSISDIYWVDKDTLLIAIDQLQPYSNLTIFKVLHLGYADKISVKSGFEFNIRGSVIDSLPSVENEVYISYRPQNRRKISTGAFRVNLKDEETFNLGLNPQRKIAAQIKNPIYWLRSPNNTIDFIMSKEDKKIIYWTRDKNKWKSGISLPVDSPQLVIPEGINEYGELIVIKRIDGKDKKGVYLLNAETLSVIKEIYYNKDHEVYSIDLDGLTGTVININFEKNGILVDIPVSLELKKVNKMVKEKYPDYDILFLKQNQSASRYLYLIHNFQNEGVYVDVNLEGNKIHKIIEKSSWRNQLIHAELKQIDYTTDDGYSIESYLSLPSDHKIKALLVMPHGGPIGIRNYGYYDSLSHFLAYYGIAILKVNYRGSSGFGKKFMDAGKKMWGTGIERDINGVVDKVLGQFDVSPNKICAGGMSYGGYSALMLHINYPQRYKCIISIAGPTDLPLMFTSSDWNISDEAVKNMTEIIGDPQHDLEKLKNVSPLYNSERINAPVLLIHGTDDQRVSSEHSKRLNIILNKLNKKVKLVLMPGVKHGFTLLKNEIFYAEEMLKFINENLELKLKLDSVKDIHSIETKDKR